MYVLSYQSFIGYGLIVCIFKYSPITGKKTRNVAVIAPIK